MSQSQCLVPISLGELFDKYSILQIKSERVVDNEKLTLVEKELADLTPLVKKYPLDISYKKSIKTINEKLWDIEDKIRQKEKKNEFDKEFVELARQVYKTNDERCVIKNKINVILNSDITEIKSYVDLETNVSLEPANKVEPETNVALEPAKKVEPETKVSKKTKQKSSETSEKEIHKQAQEYKNSSNIFLAIEEYDKLLSLSPKNPSYLRELGELYLALGSSEKALEQFNKIYSLDKNDGVNLNNLGICYFNQKLYDKAIDYFKMVLHIKNDIPDVYNNIGTCYVNSKRYKQAETTFLVSLRLRQDNDIYEKLANLYYYMKKYDDAISFYKKITQNKSTIQYNLSFPYLNKNKFAEGFKLYENRLEENNIHPQTNQRERVEIPNIPYWTGKEHCENLLIVYEQGIGDNILYFRFIIQLSERNPEMKITYFCRGIFEGFFKSYPNITIKTDLTITHLSYNYKLYIMSLPYILKIDKITPNRENYIIQNPVSRMYWKNKLEPLKKTRVGFVYNGLLLSFIEKYIPLKEFAKLTKLDIDLICLCKLDDIKNDIDTNDKNINKIHFYDIDKKNLFNDTTSILPNIDLLITIDTAIVHLAGVVNMKTWLLLGYGSDWRWYNDPSKTSWYDSVELIRMTENTDLQNIMPVVEKKLKQFIKEKAQQEKEEKEKEEQEKGENIIVLD
jgi:tetratricopeptide (TPR) repeat protein